MLLTTAPPVALGNHPCQHNFLTHSKIKSELSPRGPLQSFLHQNSPSESLDHRYFHRFQASSLACSPHFLQLNVALTAAANTMDQGSNYMPLLPVNFDIDGTLSEDDWNNG
jgi:hypothetical protein